MTVRPPKDADRDTRQMVSDINRRFDEMSQARVTIATVIVDVPALVDDAFPVTIAAPFAVGAVAPGGIRNLTTPTSVLTTGAEARWELQGDGNISLLYVTGLDVNTRYEIRLVLVEES